VTLFYRATGGSWQSQVFQYTAIHLAPNAQGIYSLAGTGTTTGCSDPSDNGTGGVTATLNINNQTGSNFSGTISLTDPFGFFSGTVSNGTIAQNGAVTGSFFINQPSDDRSQGTFTGSLSGNTLSLNISGQDLDDTCSFTGSMTGSR
jgi:hypothetical protein